MRNIELGNREIKIHASPLTPYIYKKNFNQTFSSDLIELSQIQDDMTKLDDVNVLQMIWAMEKTDNNRIDDFETWLSKLEKVDLGEVIQDVTEEAMNATFHTKNKETKEPEEITEEL